MSFENGSNCSTVVQDSQGMMTTTQSTLVITAYLCLTVTILFGNTSVIWAYIKYPNVREIPFNIFILNLAVTDLCVGIFNVPFHALTILYPGLEYRNFLVSVIILYVGYVLALTSVFTIAAMCYDQCKLVFNPITYQKNSTHRVNSRIVIALWSFSCVYCSCILVLRGLLRKGASSCGSNIPYLIVMLIGNIFIPFLSVLSLKCVIVVKLQLYFLRINNIFRRSTKRQKEAKTSEDDFKGMDELRNRTQEDGNKLSQIPQISSPGHIYVISTSRLAAQDQSSCVITNEDIDVKEHSEQSKSDSVQKNGGAAPVSQHPGPMKFRVKSTPTLTKTSSCHQKIKRAWKAARNVVIFAFIYLSCWSPTHVYFFIKAVQGTRLYDSMDVVQNVLYIILYLNAAINPLVYAWMSRQFAQGMKNMFC